MPKDLFKIKSRIFKRERVRENQKNLTVVSKKRDVTNKNQIELSWTNSNLESKHLLIVGRVLVKEWERLLKKYAIIRCFIQLREENEVRLYLSFQVPHVLSSQEIKEIMSKATAVLEECLEKVTEKVTESDPSKNKKQSSTEVEETKEDKIIRKLHQEIEEQEKLLSQLTTVQQKPKTPTDLPMANFSAKEEKKANQLGSGDVFFYEKEKKDLLKELDLKNSAMVSLKKQTNAVNQENLKLAEELTRNQTINRQLDKANIKLNDKLKEIRVNANRLEKMPQLENKARELQQENSDYRIQLNESQSMVEKYRNQVTQLNKNLESSISSQEELVEKAQIDYSKLDDNLKEAEKKLILETNERQKADIQLEELRTKLAKSGRHNEEQEEKTNKLAFDLSNQLELREKAVEQVEIAEKTLEIITESLKMSEATNEVLKEEIRAFERQKEKLTSIDEWQLNYQELESKFIQLENERLGYGQEVSFLTGQLQQMEERLVEAEDAFDAREPLVQKPATSPKPKDFLMDWETESANEYEEDFFYETDPFVEAVMTEELVTTRQEDQKKDELLIKELLEDYYEEGFHDIKVLKSDYRKAVLNFKFLGFRWSQVTIMDESDKRTDFLKWCEPFIKKIESFEEELSLDVKKSFFSKNYVTIDESTYNILQGYSELSTYLDTYYLKVSYYIDKYFLNEGNG